MPDNDNERDIREAKRVSRRDFLKIAGVTGAAVGLSGGLGGLLAACGKEEETTTTAAAAATTTTAALASTATSAAAASTTTVSAGAETGRPLKIGVLSPQTGSLASFAKPDQWIVDTITKTLKDGVLCGDQKIHTFEFKIEDTQSKTDRAASVAGDLINAKYDMLLASSSPDVVNPAADQCEAFGMPLLATFVPWQPFYLGRQKDAANPQPFKWTWMYHFGLEDAAQVRMGMWEQVQTNQKVGLLFPNDSDGTSWANEKTGFTAKVKAAGYEVTQPGLHEATADDFTVQIAAFKKAGCEIVSGIETPPVFTNFWKQAIQQDFKPKIACFGKALLFHQTLVALGDSGIGLSDEIVWHPTFPYKSSLSGQTCQQLADQYTTETGEGWTEPLGQYGKFEWMVDVYKRMTDIENKELFPTIVAQTKMDTIQGPVDFTLPVKAGTAHPVPNVFKIRIAAGQWLKVTGGKWPYDINICFADGPEIPTTATLQQMQYA